MSWATDELRTLVTLLWASWWPILLLLDVVDLGANNPEVVGAAIEAAIVATLNLVFYFVKPKGA